MGVRVCDRTRPGRGITKFRGGNALRKQLVEAEKGDNAGCGGRERFDGYGTEVEASEATGGDGSMRREERERVERGGVFCARMAAEERFWWAIASVSARCGAVAGGV